MYIYIYMYVYIYAYICDDQVSLLRKEIQVMWDLDHENIVRYLGTGQSDKYLFIILEYVPGGSIQNMLTQFGSFNESLIWRFSSQILAGIYIYSYVFMYIYVYVRIHICVYVRIYTTCSYISEHFLNY
jgi:serine/threonine protein kinase